MARRPGEGGNSGPGAGTRTRTAPKKRPVGSAVTKAAPKKITFGGPTRTPPRRNPAGDRPADRPRDLRRAESFKRTPKYRRAQRAATKVALRDALREVSDAPRLDRAKEKPGLLAATAHLLYPKPKKGASPRRPRPGSLPGAASGGGRALDLPNSAVGIVLRSTASTTAQQPGRTAGDTAKSALLIPAGLLRAALHPAESAKAVGEDYSRRYAPALRGEYRQFHRRQLAEGAAPEVFDIAGVAAGGASVTGRLAQNLAAAGRLGQKAERIATTAKPLRVAGGKAGVVTREPSKNFYKNVTRAKVDQRRGKKLAKREAGTRTALEDVALREGQIVYASRRKQARVQRKMIAKRGGEVLAAMKAEQAREVLGKTGVAGTVRGLSRDERRGLNLASRYGIRTPEQARTVITALEQRITAERAARAAAGDPVRPLNDELPILAALKADAEKVFTPRLREAVKHEGNRNRRLSAQDPALVQEQTLARAHQPAADLLGITRRTEGTPIYRGVSGKDGGPLELHPNGRTLAGNGTSASFSASAAKTWGRGHTPSVGHLNPSARGISLKEAEKAARGKETATDAARRLGYDYIHEKGVAGPDGQNLILLTEKAIAPGGETAAQFARRVRQQGSKQGLGAPAYFKSEEIPRNVFSAFAKGGRRAVAGEKTYQGVLAATGRESHSPEILVRGAAQNIKRRYNWNLVGDTVDEHVLPWSKEKKFNAHELEKEVIRRGIDPNSVRLWNPRLYREIRDKVDELGPDADPTHVDATVEAALRRASPDLHDAAIHPDDFQRSGWQVLDKAAYDEVMGTVGGAREGVVGRGYDIAKGKVSRVLLANPAWLGFQVASNTFTAGLAGVTPADFVRAQRFFGREAMRDPKHAAAVEATFGVHGWYDAQRMLGSTSNARFVDAYRAMKETAFYRKAHSANPLDLLFFRPDNAQNNAFRRALMYNRLKRETYQRMGREAGTLVATQQRIAGILNGPPEDVMRRLTRNRPLLEKHAQTVDDFLGNWTTYTTKERHLFSRAVMFYGFLRFSTRLAFYTMPAKHPVMSSILLQIGRMEKDELKRIFGTEPPPWEYGNFYAPNKAWGQGVSDAEIAKGVTRYPTNRLVPFFNAVTAASGAGELGMTAPFVGAYLNYKAGKNIALDSPYQVNGSTAYVQHAKDMSGGTRRRVALAETLSLSPYYRAAAAAFLKGKQGDDSLLLSPRPIQYKDPAKIAENQAKIRTQEGAGVLGAFQRTLAPQLGTPGGPVITNARRFNAPKKPKARKGSGSSFVYGGASSNGGSFVYGGSK